MYGPLEKWLNSYPSQGYIQQFESVMGHFFITRKTC